MDFLRIHNCDNQQPPLTSGKASPPSINNPSLSSVLQCLQNDIRSFFWIFKKLQKTNKSNIHLEIIHCNTTVACIPCSQTRYKSAEVPFGSTLLILEEAHIYFQDPQNNNPQYQLEGPSLQI